MTVRVRKSSENDDSHGLTSHHPLSINNHSPPSKKLRLSLKGQRQLGAILSSHQAFRDPKEKTSPDTMQNIRPSLLDPMSLHVSYTSGGSLGLITPSYPRMDMNGDGDVYDRDRERQSRLEPSLPEKSASLPPVATLLNLGNTCFLNSVLYTLRFTPGFAHLLHHLAADLAEKKLLSVSAVGSGERKIGFLSSGSPGSRTKSLSSLSPYNVTTEDNGIVIEPTKRKTLVLTERLHELFQTLHSAEHKGDLSEPFQADAFLQALREVNPLFQGNQQQDAHELLVCFLDYLREACQLVDKVQTKSAAAENPPVPACVDENDSASTVVKKGKQAAEKKKKTKKIFAEKAKKGKRVSGVEPKSADAVLPNNVADEPQTTTVEETNTTPDAAAGTRDFISESFEGVTVLRTTCLECEYVTEMKESFMHICVPIISDIPVGDDAPLSPSAFFASTLMEVDFLRDSNKYWCEQCVRYNEARRSVHYEKLPRLLVLQLKRFSLSFGSTVHTSKVNDYMPTPMHLDCFCEQCQLAPESPIHSYKLYAIIMHLGATMASGHYVAYTRMCPSTVEYATCTLNKPVSSAASQNLTNRPYTERNNTSNNSSASGILRFFKPKSSNGLATEPVISGGHASPVTLCRSVGCCSAHPRKLFPDPSEKEKDKEREKESGGRESPASSSSNSSTSNLPEDLWLECDDEVIRVLRVRELEDLLSRKPRTSALTPYLLFYVQTNPVATNGVK